MPTVQSHLHLNIPADTLLHYLAEPTHLTEFCSNVIGVGSIQPHPPYSVKFSWIYKMLGVRLEGNAEIRQDRALQQVSLLMRGGIHGNWTWRMTPPEEGQTGTLLSVTIEYEMPGEVLKKHTRQVLERHNEQSVECMLRNLKTLLEVHDTPTKNPA